MVKAIFFDLDDTLLWDQQSVKEAFRETCEWAAEQSGADCSGLEQAVREEARQLYAGYPTYAFTQMIGINPFEGLWGHFDDPGDDFQKLRAVAPSYQQESWTRGLNRLGINDPALGKQLARFFPEARKRNPILYKDSLEVLDQLKGRFDLLLLTNGSPSLQQIKLEITPEIAPFFDHIVISGAFGRGKPDVDIFRHSLEKFDYAPEDVLMVGDNPMTDILGAERAGIPSVWLNREHKTPHDSVMATYEIQDLTELLPLLEKLEAESA
ncbi:HAD family hydrolase [Planococcus sp. ISL-109]|uniref:HAD family hydrolase n=1 Tax=Planococcus sp. ISL-109 TaxID=2819166 RepID=UPI001BE92F52|nr:HAD family hydrolase [Planococcus sp. ISL-109]MBT2582675.1 HAD family hydrolase [Planococcus sp. ISL-109]